MLVVLSAYMTTISYLLLYGSIVTHDFDDRISKSIDPQTMLNQSSLYDYNPYQGPLKIWEQPQESQVPEASTR